MFKLSELCNEIDQVSVAVDGDVSDIGYVDTDTAQSLVHASSRAHILRALHNKNVSSILTTSELAQNFFTGGKAIAISESPRDVFYTLHEFWLGSGYYSTPVRNGLGVDCEIHPSAILEGNVELGDRVVIGPNVVLTGAVRIGSDSRIDAGARIGVDGILYTTLENFCRPVRHAGWVDIGSNVTLFSGSTVVRSVHPSAPTTIGKGSIVGVNTVVGHDSKIGLKAVISGQTVIARRARIGDDAHLGTQAFIREHVSIGSHSHVMAGSVVIGDVKPGDRVSGNFAEPHHQRMMRYAKNRLN